MKPSTEWWRYLAPLAVIAIIALLPVPAGLENHTWLYFAVFTGVIVGLILEPVPGAVVAMVGISIIAILSPWLLFSPEQLAQPGFKFTAKSLSWAVSGFSNSVIWLIFAAFMFGTGYEKTGLGRRIALILDESFLDFAEDKEASLLTDEILNRYPGLYIVKSISKSYGVPGLRLGILASQDKERLDRIKKAVSIWNINSMAEFFMQILDKYKKDYEEALVELRKERERFYRKLCQIEGLKVYPSSANYFMCELVNGGKSEELAAELLEEQILIKDLTGKIANGRQYVRIAVRSRRENEQLAEALKIKFL